MDPQPSDGALRIRCNENKETNHLERIIIQNGSVRSHWRSEAPLEGFRGWFEIYQLATHALKIRIALTVTVQILVEIVSSCHVS